MTTLTVTLSGVCAGGGHLTFTVTGAKVLTVPMNRDDLLEPLSREDAVAFCRVIAWMAKDGRTIAQARTLLQTGVTVTV